MQAAWHHSTEHRCIPGIMAPSQDVHKADCSRLPSCPSPWALVNFFASQSLCLVARTRISILSTLQMQSRTWLTSTNSERPWFLPSKGRATHLHRTWNQLSRLGQHSSPMSKETGEDKSEPQGCSMYQVGLFQLPLMETQLKLTEAKRERIGSHNTFVYVWL